MHFDQFLQSPNARFKDGTCGRYAPSPTGPQHLGNLRTALLAWLQARLAGGCFVLRMDDLDLPRVRAGSATQIMDDLYWLGLDWDEGPDIGGPAGPYVQSERDPYYRAAFDLLKRQGRLYPCCCSRRDIAEAASAPHEQGATLRYPGTCRSSEPMSDWGDGVEAAWRFRLQRERLRVVDQLAGWLEQDLVAEVGDFVVRRRDGIFAYQLATVVDDAFMGVTDVVRGLDLFDSTPRQAALARALELPMPRYWHAPLLCDDDGVRLSKRNGSASLAELRCGGLEPGAVVGSLAASCGLVEAGATISSQELLRELDLDTYRRLLQKGSDLSS